MQTQNDEITSSVAKDFFSDNKDELLKELEFYFSQASENTTDNPVAIIAPHAGYVFSGIVAASAYNQLKREKKYDHIFIIGSSHSTQFEGVSVLTQGSFVTPLGTVELDSLTEKLVESNSIFKNTPSVHQNEHSIFVQLPFLQYWLKQPFSVVPILLGCKSKQTCKELAQILSPFFNTKNLFIVSTDFSHYPEYYEAILTDSALANEITANSVDRFVEATKNAMDPPTPGLVTSICGCTAMLTMLYLTQDRKNIRWQKIMYKNSGDSVFGNKKRVVGYWAMAVDFIGGTNSQLFNFSKSEQQLMLSMARVAITNELESKAVKSIDINVIPKSLEQCFGIFVTLKNNGKLRGCIGRFQNYDPLYTTIPTIAIESATHDHRFPRLRGSELTDITIEISILSPLKKIENTDEIELGKHGIYIKKGDFSGAFLPQVLTETGWDLEQFLGHCARDKANIGWDGWRDAEIFIFEAFKFSE